MVNFDVEYLQKLTYNRSKVWSNFLEKHERNEENEEEIDVTKIDEIFSTPVNDESDDLFFMEDDDCEETVNPEFLKNATNISRISTFIGNTAADLPAISKNEEERQYADVINKTLPVLYEHERQLQEFGFDKVLISFKKDEIEDKFGSWLNRHNSLFGGDRTLIYGARNKNDKPGKELTIYNQPTKDIESQEVDSDSNDSLQSGETARYIRSSRVGNVKNSTTTMIKTYRMVKKTREALREKYACETDEEDYNVNALRVRRKLERMDHQSHVKATPCFILSKNERAAFTSRTQRRKVLRKRITGNSCNLDYSSSDSVYTENYRKTHCNKLKICCNQLNHCASIFYHTPLKDANRNRKILKTCSTTKLSSAARNRMHYFSHSLSSSSSPSSSASFNSITERRRCRKRRAKFSNDGRPYKRESECCCFNNKPLCTQYKHVADTSTEEWYVEDGCTPEKQLKTPMVKTQNKKPQQSKSCRKEILQPATEKKRNIKNKNNLKENKTEGAFEGEDSFDYELKMAIKASNESFMKEQEKILKKGINIKSTRFNRKLPKIEENVPEKKKAVKKNKKTENVAKKPSAMPDLSCTVNKPNEDTFFAPIQNQAICNSTALSSKGHAYKRQFADKQLAVSDVENDTTPLENTQRKMQKPISEKLNSTKIKKANNCHNENGDVNIIKVTSTTIRSPESMTLCETVENKQMEQNAEKTCTNQSDCADVTSTTNVEMEKSEKTNKKETEKAPQRTRTVSPDDEMTRNCVLIYAPKDGSSFAANGYFTITQEHLSKSIGQKAAQKILKYASCKRFRLDSTVYYKPPSASSLYQNLSSSSESADDLERIGEYGKLFAV